MPDLSIIRPEIHLNGDKTCNDLPPPQACQEAITLASLGPNHCPPRPLAYSVQYSTKLAALLCGSSEEGYKSNEKPQLPNP